MVKYVLGCLSVSRIKLQKHDCQSEKMKILCMATASGVIFVISSAKWTPCRLSVFLTLDLQPHYGVSKFGDNSGEMCCLAICQCHGMAVNLER